MMVWRKAKERDNSPHQESSPVLGSGSWLHATLLIATQQSPTTTSSPRQAPVGFPDFSGPIHISPTHPPLHLALDRTLPWQDPETEKPVRMSTGPKQAFSEYHHWESKDSIIHNAPPTSAHQCLRKSPRFIQRWVDFIVHRSQYTFICVWGDSHAQTGRGHDN